MSDRLVRPCTAFLGPRRITAGPLIDVAMAVKHAGDAGPVLVFDDASGEVIDLDLRGSKQDIAARIVAGGEPQATAPAASGRGRPKLGVVGREVTLLPRHWEWLAAQPGGASVALRKLVEEARRKEGGRAQTRQRQDAAYRFLSALAGDLPGYEEAIRALFAGDRAKFERQAADWPGDVRDYALTLAFPGADTPAP